MFKNTFGYYRQGHHNLSIRQVKAAGIFHCLGMKFNEVKSEKSMYVERSE
jgi:hypothetical protein